MEKLHWVEKNKSFLFSDQRWVVWLGWGREGNGSKVASDCIFLLGFSVGTIVLHVCFLSSFGIPKILIPKMLIC